jgi:hypothetical protein
MQPQERAPTLQLQPRGLTESEVAARRSQGLTNVLPVKTSRAYLQVLGENVFTVINDSICHYSQFFAVHWTHRSAVK